MQMRRLVGIGLLLATGGLACSDSSGPGNGGPRGEGELNILKLDASSPPLFNPVDSFYAKKGEDRELRVFFQDAVGGAGEEYLRLRVDAPTLLARPDGTPFLVGDSVLITVRITDPSKLLFEFEPAGLTFNPLKPAELKIEYAESDHDFNDDGVEDSEDDRIEGELAIWRQDTPGGPFARLTSLLFEEADEAERRAPLAQRPISTASLRR
jgi:hypothetical protein